jgi:hypothetical protein
MQWIKQTKQLVHGGIYGTNLDLIVTAASKGLESDRNILAAFVIRQVAESVFYLWEGRTVQQPERRIVEEGLRPALDAVLDALLGKAPQADIIVSLEALIVAWQTIQTELRDLADLNDG